MKTRVLIIIGIIMIVSVSIFVMVAYLQNTGNADPAFLADYPRIEQNDLYCWTQWYVKDTVLNEDELILSIREAIAEFGPHVDIPNREISIDHNKEEMVISIAGSWTEDQMQHDELTSIVKKYIKDTKIIRDDIVACA